MVSDVQENIIWNHKRNNFYWQINVHLDRKSWKWRLETNWHNLNGCTEHDVRKRSLHAVVQQMVHSSAPNAIRINFVFGAQTYWCTPYFRNSPNSADTRGLGFPKSWSLNILMQQRKETHTSLFLFESCMQTELSSKLANLQRQAMFRENNHIQEGDRALMC